MYYSSLKSFVVDGSEKSVRDTVSKLKFIAKIKENDIVDVSSMTLSQQSIKTSLYRTFIARTEAREKTLEFYQQTIDTGFDLADEYLKKEEIFLQKIGEMIIKSIEKCIPGLKNHIITYSNYQMHVSCVEALIDTIEVKLDEIKINFPKNFQQ